MNHALRPMSCRAVTLPTAAMNSLPQHSFARRHIHLTCAWLFLLLFVTTTSTKQCVLHLTIHRLGITGVRNVTLVSLFSCHGQQRQHIGVNSTIRVLTPTDGNTIKMWHPRRYADPSSVIASAMLAFVQILLPCLLGFVGCMNWCRVRDKYRLLGATATFELSC